MPTGKLQVFVTTQESIPLKDVKITIVDSENMKELQEKTSITDAEGKTKKIDLETRSREISLDPNSRELGYKNYDIKVEKTGYIVGDIIGLQIFEGETSIQYIDLLPRPVDYGNDYETQLNIGETEKLYEPVPDLKEGIDTYVLQQVIIPDYITVHLGTPTSNATNVKVPFITYIKSVAASEIYPTWPRAALRANILAQISFALNRIYTEWYKSKGYSYNITNSPSYDQKYVHNRNTFDSINKEVEDIFNNYVTKQGRREPFFTEYCDGKSVTCKGMSQWGSYEDAKAGKSELQILRKYYGNDVLIKESNNITSIPASYPGTPIRKGATGDNVKILQAQLNRIGDNYPSITKLTVDGVFGASMETAVKRFQTIFSLTSDGVVGKSTWYKISYIYVSVKKLAQLTSEGEAIEDGTYPGYVVQKGDTGTNVYIVQFYINQTAVYVSSIDDVKIDGIFGAKLETSVKQFQKFFNLTQDGKVGELTWNKMYETYQSIKNGVSTPPQVPPSSDVYPGTLIKLGSSGPNVVKVQNWINGVSEVYTSVKPVAVDGKYGPNTRNSVIQFQRRFNLAQDGIVGPDTWNKLYNVWQDLVGDAKIN